MTHLRLNISKKRHHLPALVCDGVNRIRRTYDSQGTLLRAEYGTERIEFTSPEPGQAGAIVATPVFDLARVADRCGPVEYADHAVERYIHEAGWIDSHGRHVAAVRDCRGSLRATWTAHSALPPASGNDTNSNPSASGNPSGNSNSALTLPGPGIGQVFPTGGNVYADLTAYYPFGLPFADWQGASRDLFSGKELERSGNLLDYDFHARRLDPQLLIFDKPDPLAATYPHLNPYLYCAANPVSLTDPSGRLVSAPESRHLSGFIDDMVFAVGLDANDEKDYRKLFKIDYYRNTISPIKESKFEKFIAEIKPSEDQEIIMRYTLYAINNKKNTFIIDYTPDNEEFSPIANNIINNVFKEYFDSEQSSGTTYPYTDFYGNIRNNWGSAVSFQISAGGFSTINPGLDSCTRSKYAVHEVLGHSIGFALSLSEEHNNVLALRMESCFNRIHELPPTEINNHRINDRDDIYQRPSLTSSPR